MGEFIGLVPPAEGFVQTPQFNFGLYANRPRYQEVNRDLIARGFEILKQEKIMGVDVATGHGMVPRQASLVVEGTNIRLFMVCTDLDEYAVKTAKAEIPDTPNARFTFIQGDARDLPRVLSGHISPGQVDYTSINDALHEMRAKELKLAILKSQAEILKPGGLFSFNSAFTTKSVFREWAVWQMEFMKIMDAERYRGGDIEGLPVLSPEDYRDLIEGRGLRVIHEAMVSYPHYKQDLEGISDYPPFAKGFTEKMVFKRPVSLAKGIQGMKDAITPTLTRLKTDTIPRVWYEVIAQKPF